MGYEVEGGFKYTLPHIDIFVEAYFGDFKHYLF